MAFLASSKVSNEENYLLQKIARLFGTNNIATAQGSAMRRAFTRSNLPWELVLKQIPMRIWRAVGPYSSGGYNPAETHPVIMDYILRVKRNGAKIIVVDVRETRTMAFADYRLVISPERT